MRPDRQWMYQRMTRGCLNQEFKDGLQKFIDFASSQSKDKDGDKIRCPCNGNKCQNRVYHDLDTVKFHVAKFGFVPDYYIWDCHGETNVYANNLCVSESDYYGQLIEVIELEYPALPIKRTVLFKCDWFDPTPNSGTKVHKEYKLVEVNYGRRLNGYEPFALAVQVNQVYYCKYPSIRREKSDWRAVLKIKARSVVDITETTNGNDQSPFQEDEVDIHNHDQMQLDEETVPLNDPNGPFIELEDDDVEQEDEPLLESDEENLDSTEEEELYEENTDSD